MDWRDADQVQLTRFLRRHRDWHAQFYGNFTVTGGSDRVHVTPWQLNHDTYWRTLSMDVGIGPLRNTPFNRAKSSLRAVEYAALGVVAVLPDLPPYRGWIDDGVTGVLVRHPDGLYAALADVAADPAHMARMAAAARLRAAQWTTEASIGRWVDAWNSR
jgi:glycosyltransferase involved in cell wall biosynthesis